MPNRTQIPLFLYTLQSIYVSRYIKAGAQATVSVGVRGCTAFLAGAIQSAAKSFAKVSIGRLLTCTCGFRTASAKDFRGPALGY
jgi:hypothetical protein